MTDDLDPTIIQPPEADEPAVADLPPEADRPPVANVATAEVQASPSATSRGSRSRWVVALGIIAVVVVASVLAIGLFTGRAANAVVLGYVPSDAIMYGEVRLDLPGDQRNAVGALLSKFPGFADQSAIETKIDEVFDRIVGNASGGKQAYSSDIKPWFAGQLAFSVGALPDPATLSGADAAMQSARILILASIKDEAIATSWFDSAIAAKGTTTSTEPYGGATLTRFTVEGQPEGAYALLGGKVAVIGDVASVKAAIDTKGAGTLASQPGPKAALEATTGDHVGFVYVALRPLLDWAGRLDASQVPGGLSPASLSGFIPDWAAVALRVENDAVVMETLSPKAAGAAAAEARSSAVADHVPAGAIALSISHDYGQGLLKTLDGLRADAGLKPAVDAIDQAISVLGGSDAAIGWIGDLGVTVVRADAGIEGGLVIVPTDRAAADRLFTSLKTLASLGGATIGVTVHDEAYAGTTITIVDLGNLADLAAGAGVSPDMLGTGLPTGRVELAYAITDQVVVLGSGPGFVRHVLDTTAATSLGSNERYKALAARAGQGTGVGFIDLTAIRELVESAMAGASAADRTDYEQNVKPFLVPFDALVASTTTQGEINRSTLIVTVK